MKKKKVIFSDFSYCWKYLKLIIIIIIKIEKEKKNFSAKSFLGYCPIYIVKKKKEILYCNIEFVLQVVGENAEKNCIAT